MDCDTLAPFAVGLAIMIGGAWWGFSQYAFLQRSPAAEGKVVEQYTEKDTKSSTLYYPVVEFKTREGSTVRFRGRVGNAGGPTIPTGRTVSVVYDPADPSSAQIKTFGQIWLGPVCAGLLGLCIVAVGFALVAKNK